MATITAADIATITDNCGVDSVTIGLTQFGCSDIGMNLVSIQVADAAGNTMMGSALVTVADSLPVMIVCPNSLTAFSCDSVAVVNYDPPMLSSGACNANPGTPTLVSGIPSGGIFPVGTTTNTFSYTDAAGTTTTCSFDVTIFQGTIDIILDAVTPPTAGNNDGTIDITVTGANPLTFEWFLNGTLVSTDEDPTCLLYTSPSPRDRTRSRMPSSA